jgi:hypothetical protein
MDVTTLLQDLAESPAPPTTVDIARAAATGRRRVQLRRVAVSAALVTVVVLLGVGTYVGGTTALPAPPAPAAPTSAPPRPMPTAAPAAFDPLVQYAAFGWVPPGAQITDTSTSHHWMSVALRYAGAPAPEGSTATSQPDPGSVTLVVTAAGYGLNLENTIDPAVLPDAMRGGAAAEPVNGRRAETLMAYGYRPALRWEYAPGAWAAVLVADLPGQDPLETAHRVAADVRFDDAVPVTLPFRAAAPSAPLYPSVVHVSRAGEHWGVQVDYGDGQVHAQDPPLTILAVASTRETGDGAVIGDPTTTVDGHPARTAPLLDGGSALQLFNVNGVYLELTTHSATTTAQLPGGLVGLFRSLDLTPDPARWR